MSLNFWRIQRRINSISLTFVHLFQTFLEKCRKQRQQTQEEESQDIVETQSNLINLFQSQSRLDKNEIVGHKT